MVLTQGGAEFITPLTLQALAGRPVHQQLLDADAEAGMGHIALARWADVVLVAPASADFLARLVQGRADDLLAAVCLATDAQLAVAPAMNRQMWASSATQANIGQLTQRGITVLGPDSGEQACGEVGEGRMLEVADILAQLAGMFESSLLAGVKVMVTAGPTREAIDPVRYLGNHSSGKMGFAIAQAASEAGARVTLISGPVSLATPDRVTRIDVDSAADMYRAIMDNISGQQLFIGAAAVADYRPQQAADAKIKKDDDTMHLTLVRNPDILAEVAALEHGPFTVGFAAETDDLLVHAQDKLQRKHLDMIAANQVGDGQGFDSDENALTLLARGGRRVELPAAAKTQLARNLIKEIAQEYHANHSAQDT